MVKRDPHQSADIILGFLMGVNGARTGAILSADDATSLLVGHFMVRRIVKIKV